MRKLVHSCLAALMLFSPALAQASNPARTDKATLKNVELQPDGRFSGQLLSEAGMPVMGVEIKLHEQSNLKAVAQSVRTDKNGKFAVKGLNSGTCVVTVGDDSYACRVWKNGTAPPKSLKTVALIAEADVVRGNCGTGDPCRPSLMQRLRCLSTGQKVGLGLIIAAAITLPIVLSDDDGS